MFGHCGLRPQKPAAWDMLNTLKIKTMEQASTVPLVLIQHLLYTCGKSAVLGRQLRTHEWKDCRERLGRHKPSSRLPNDTIMFVKV